MAYEAFNYRFSIYKPSELKEKNAEDVALAKKAQAAHIDSTVHKLKADFSLQETDTIAMLRERAHEKVMKTLEPAKEGQ